jgi:hypothetical protein
MVAPTPEAVNAQGAASLGPSPGPHLASKKSTSACAAEVLGVQVAAPTPLTFLPADAVVVSGPAL